MSRQQVYLSKTSIFFSKNVGLDDRNMMVNMSGFHESLNLGNYLGVPYLGRTPRKKDFHYLTENVKNHLAWWKSQQLSLAG